MQVLAPDILEDTRRLSPFICVVVFLLGLLLWLFGGYSHRFWLSAAMTLTGGVVGLQLGRDYNVQPLVSGLLLSLAAGAMALALARITVFLAGGLAGLVLLRAWETTWNELVCFLMGGLIGVCFYQLWITALSSLAGTVLMSYGLVSLLDHLGRMDSVEWARRNGPLINWGVAVWTMFGVLVQYLLDRRRKKRAANQGKEAKKEEEKQAAPPPAPSPSTAPAASSAPAATAESAVVEAYAGVVEVADDRENRLTRPRHRSHQDDIMWRSLLPWFASLFLALACCLPASRAQQPPPSPPAPAPGAEPAAEQSHVLTWGVAVLFTLVILLIVCMPSRKS